MWNIYGERKLLTVNRRFVVEHDVRFRDKISTKIVEDFN